MTDKHSSNAFKTLDRDLKRISVLESANYYISKPLVAPGLALAFLILAGLVSAIFFTSDSNNFIILAAAIMGAYMAINIGANDVANNMAPAVGANALTMTGAIAIAAIFESMGALLAGGDVVSTISKGIIDPSGINDANIFIWAMMAALLSSALWVNLATWIGAPVSTTHSVVGGVMGAGIAAAGLVAVNWPTMGKIAASWIISPVLGGVIAALFLSLIKSKIIYTDDKIKNARRWVPILIAIMIGAFTTYLAMKGLKKIIKIDLAIALSSGVVIAFLGYLVSKPLINKQAKGLENKNKSVKILFRIPLIFSAALLSFAHGANDVANAVGPLAAIVHSVQFDSFSAKVVIPLWVMMIGAFGISFGLFLFGPKLIRRVGSQITKLNPMRGYCIALSAAITVIIASWLGLPVSSTHIALGAVFGVGFFREWDAERRKRLNLSSGKIKSLGSNERHRRKLIRRSHFLTILAAWVITVPCSATISAAIYFGLNYLMV